MSFPAGTPTVTLVGTLPSAVAGTPFQGRLVLAPSAYLVDSTRNAVYAGGGAVTITNGSFSVQILPCDAAGILPTGWRWRVDIQPTGGKRIQYWANITGTGTVDISDLTPVPAPNGGSSGGGGGAVSSVNGMIGAVVLDADDVDADPEGTAAAAVTAHAAATDPHGDRAAAATALASHEADTTSVHGISNTANLVVTTDPRLSDTRTPTAHASSHAAAGSDPVNLAQSQVSGLVTALAALLAKAGGTVTGDLTVDGANLTVTRADDTGAYRLRVTGGGLDFEIAGLDVTVSHWQNADFTGTQSNVMRWEAAGPHLIGRTQFGTSPFDTVHDLDAGTGVAAVGKKNSLSNIRFCGRRASAGAPTSGTWSVGDTVQDSLGALWLCTTGGTPGTWVGGGAADPWVFDVTAYGALGNGKVASDAAMTSGSAVLTCSTSTPFTAGDVGKNVMVLGAGSSGETLVGTISAYTDSSHVTLSATAGSSVSGVPAMWASDDTVAIQAAIDAAVAYAGAHAGAATVLIPPAANSFYGVAGALRTGGSTLGNAQLTLPVVAATARKLTLTIQGAHTGAGVQHWQQTVPNTTGSTLVSFGLFANSTAQTNSINAAGNPAVIGGPAQPGGYGVAPGNFSNLYVDIGDLSILTCHSKFGLTYTAIDLSGVANAQLRDGQTSTTGVVAPPAGSYVSPGVFATGLSIGILLPANGNNDCTIVRNWTIGGGYTYGLLATEHTDIYGLRILYCWAALCPVGTYYSSVGAAHSINGSLISIEQCTYLIYVFGPGTGGLGPTMYLKIDTETSTPRFGDRTSGTGLAAARGEVVLAGLFTASGLTLDAPTGLKIRNSQLTYPITTKTSNYTATSFDEHILADATSGAVTITLPTAVGRTDPITIKKTDSSINAVTIDAAGSETIDGQLIKRLDAQWDYATLVPSGSVWYVKAAPTAAVWRRRNLPDPVLVDTLYAGTAPSISVAQTGTPTSGYVKYAPTGVTLAGTDVTGPFTYLGAGNVTVGTGTPDSTYVLPTSRYPNTRGNLTSSQAVWTVEFGTDAQIFQLRFNYQTAGMYRLSIDGRRVTELMQAVGGTTAGSTHLMTVDLGSAAPRIIRFDFYTVPFGGVFLPPGATMWSSVPNGGRFMAFGDSLSDGSAINTGGGAGTWVQRTAKLLGSNDFWDEARGGTGYITAGSFATLANRVAADVIAWNPDRLVVWAGYNDNGGVQADIATAAASLYATIKAGLPNTTVYVIGCWSPTGSPAASLTNTDATLRTAAAGAGFPFISPITGSIYNGAGTLVATHGGWITGTGRVGATTGTGNADGYIGSDAVHPTDAGHVYLARRIAAAIRELMPA